MSQSRSSVDFPATPLRLQLSCPHPPRLQHSPSLPNICCSRFPPHSGPIPPRLVDASRGNLLRRPSTPPSLAASHSPPSNLMALSETPKAEARSFLGDKSSSQPPSLLAQSATLRRRPRMERDHPHSLLTPPLTPSSSIGSTEYNPVAQTSDSITVQSVSQTQITDEEDSDTRFLLISNVSRLISSEALQFAILSSLTSAALTASDPDMSLNPNNRLLAPQSSPGALPVGDPIKGVFLRYRESHGLVILAFYDIRHAKAAKTLLSTPSNGALADCVAENQDADGCKAWLSCHSISVQELKEKVGDSAFLKEAAGGFFLTAEGNNVLTEPDGKEVRVSDDQVDATRGTEGDAAENGRRELNVTMLCNMLKSYGELRKFEAVEPDGEERGPETFFYVEHCDSRDSNAAFAALNGQVLFGMKLRVFRRERSDRPFERPRPLLGVGSESSIPFPASDAPVTASHKTTLHFGPAGEQSKHRERYLFLDPNGKARPRSVSAGHESQDGTHMSSSSAETLSSESPPYFYTSPPTSPSTVIPRPTESQDTQDRRRTSDLFLGTPGSIGGVERDEADLKRSRSLSYDGRPRDHQGESQTISDQPPHMQFYGPPHDYPYYSSGSPPASNGYPYYNACPTPPLPSSSPFFPPHLQTTPNMFFAGSPTSTGGLMYDYDQQAQMHLGMSNWGFEQAMMVPANTMGVYPGVNYAAPNMPPGVECWLPGLAGIYPQTGGPFYPPHPLDGLASSPYPPSGKLSAQDTSVQPIFVPNIHSLPPPSPNPSRRLSAPTTSAPSSREPPAGPDRNQLNLARIEDGQDTRTTVMIKNIPNKMNDKDLMAYIGAVCPRKIDFLYLRMDFQNGCNVGYAFVNFINVQDLLRFAKAKLGEKWNMFSSEKVLQMSYANYQGKEALVEKFKNSCIMDEREAWQPKIFYSEPGPEQGLPEPFPAPTHLRRKERSSYNRGPLYVPSGPPPPVQGPSRRYHHSDEQRSSYQSRRHRGRDMDDNSVYGLVEGMSSASIKRAQKK